MGKDDIVMTQDEYAFRNEMRSFMTEIKTDMKYTKEAISRIEENGCSKSGMHDRLEEKVNSISSEQTTTRWIERAVMTVISGLSGLIGGNVGR